jgi:signal transduction histidine kinase
MPSGKRQYLVVVLMAALFAALPVLAWLQYRWIGEAGRAEIERTQAGLQRSAEQLANEFNTELTRLFVMVMAGGQPDDGGRRRYAGRLNEWLAVTAHPEILKDFFVTEGGAYGVDKIDRFEPAHNRLEPSTFPAGLQKLRAEFMERMRGLSPRVAPGSELDVPVLVAPRIPPGANRRAPEPRPDEPPDERPDPYGPPQPRPPRPPPPRNDGWVIAYLNQDYIRSQWLPELTRKYFAIEGQPDYDVRVVSRQSGEIVYDSNPSAPKDAFHHPDAETGLFQLRVSPVPRGLPDAGLAGLTPGLGRWRIMVRDRAAGSVESAVTRGRARDMLVSGVVLLIMAASLVALLFAMRRAAQLATQQMQFVAAVSHELRTPLTVIRSAAENLADGIVTAPEPVKEYGVVIREEGRRLSYLVEQTLRFAGIQTGQARYNLTPTDVAAIVDDAKKSCDGLVRNAGCKLEIDVEDGLPQVLADRQSLAVSIGNLLTNAAKHASSGGWIGLRACRDGGRVRIEVRDRGPGIEPRDLRNIFQPFYRGRAAQVRQIAGAGLGLALVRQIVTAHNGEVAVDSRPGQGSCFALWLPAVDPERI